MSLRKAADQKARSWSLGGPPADSTNLSTMDFANPRQSGTKIMTDSACVVTTFPQRKRSMFLCSIASPPPLRIWPSYKMRSLVDSLLPRLRHRRFTIAQVYGIHIPCVFHPETTTLLAYPLPFKLETLNTAGINQFRTLHCEKYIRFRFTATITRDPNVSTSDGRPLGYHLVPSRTAKTAQNIVRKT